MSAVKASLLAVILPFAVACGADNGGATAVQTESATTAASTARAEPPSAQSAAETIKVAVPEVSSLIAITEDNDANDMIGRVNGYIAATVLVDSRITEGCEVAKPGIACGAGIEQWPDDAAAQKRAEYIKTILSSAPILGTEYQALKGNLLLRVSGNLKPSAAEAYTTAFTG
jgi:hypothetical protein